MSISYLLNSWADVLVINSGKRMIVLMHIPKTKEFFINSHFIWTFWA